MELKPSAPPGRASRKLRGLVSEIARLRAEGYTIRAIQETLEDAGFKTGWATVQREVARLSQSAQAAPAPRRSTSVKPASPVDDASQASPRAPHAAVEVESYFAQHNTNPLFKTKGKT